MTDSPAQGATAAPQLATRRRILSGATAAVGAAGLVAAAWPFIDQLNPDAAARANGDVVAIDLAELRAGQPRMARWHNLPIFIVRRTDDMLRAMREPTFVARMVDPDSAKRQQPPYATNWHRSIDPAYAVLAGVCTYCGCVPRYVADGDLPTDPAGGYRCPCCAAHFDPAGRAHSGIAQYNLPVPPYDVRGATLRIGKNPAGVIFSFESIERL
jgi:ubiquinol-cytochrome c reductase iron-sulfur subunit